jgi:hypothetical protein
VDAQNKGLNFQGIARNGNDEVIASSQISLRLSIVDSTVPSKTTNYAEVKSVLTNAQGLFSVIIGDGNEISKTGLFGNIDWSSNSKYLKIEMDPANGTSFNLLGMSQIQYAAFAHFAEGVMAENIKGVIPVSKGGTGFTNLIDLKDSLASDKYVGNTSFGKYAFLRNGNSDYDTLREIKLSDEFNQLFIDDTTVSSIHDLPQSVLNTSIGYGSLTYNSIGSGNTSIGSISMLYNDGSQNTAVGFASYLGLPNYGSEIMDNNTALGAWSLTSIAGKGNTSIGSNTFNRTRIINGNYNTAIGYQSGIHENNRSLDSIYNSTAIGYNAFLDASNLIQLGDSNIQNVNTFGNMNAKSFKLMNGLNNQLLVANGSVITISNDNTLGGLASSENLIPTQKSVKEYIALNNASAGISDGGVTAIKIADLAVTDAKLNLSTPNLGIPSYLVGTNITGTANGLNIGGNALTATNATTATFATNAGVASSVTTNADLSGVVTSIGNVTSIPNAVITNAMLSGNISSNKLVGTDIHTVGTITTGTWSGTVIAVNNGGTGISATEANKVFAGPNGIDGTPSFRTLTSSDIPNNLASYIQNTPSITQSATININGNIIASGIKMTSGNNPLKNNLSIGVSSMEKITTGNYNTLIGFNASRELTSGNNNSSFGNNASLSNTTGSNNNAFGSYSLVDNITGNDNNAFGSSALYRNKSDNNNAFGSFALQNNNTGQNNNAFGTYSLSFNTTGNDNVGFGFSSLGNNTIGNFNTSFGNMSSFNNTSGSNNTSIGFLSLSSNTTGANNTSIGFSSLNTNSIGNGNTAVGKNALNTNLTGSNNLAIGFGADVNASNYSNAIAIGYGAIVNASNKIQLGNSSITNVNTSGSITAGSIQNTPIGSVTPNTGSFTSLNTSSDLLVNGIKLGIGNGTGISNLFFGTGLSLNTTGNFNTVIGVDAMVDNISGNYNTAIGSQSLILNTTGSGNTAMGLLSLASNTIGNYNTAIGSQSLILNTTGSRNTAMGLLSLTNNTIGNENIAVGYYSLANNTTGNQNTSIGQSSLVSNNDGDFNVGIGLETLLSNVSGNNNTAIGYKSLNSNLVSENTAIGSMAMYANTIGTSNSAVGVNSMYSNTSGYSNTSIGYSSLYNNITGDRNTSIGDSALYNNTWGNHNTAVGSFSLFSNIGGFGNTATGYNALYLNTSGSSNVAFGDGALYSNTSGSYNTSIGSATMSWSTGSHNTAIGSSAGQLLTTGTNNTFIGNSARPSAESVNNEITLGNLAITSLRCQVTSITSLSDMRDKTDILNLTEGIDFIKKLRPVSFTWNTRDKAKVGIKSAGFIAQELLALQKASPIGLNLDLVSESNPDKLEARYGNMLPIMVKAMQDQQTIIEQQKDRLDALEKLVLDLIKSKQ